MLTMVLLSATLAADPRILDDDGGWCWFQDERCIVHDGVLYVGSVSSGHVGPARKGDVNVIMHDLAAKTTRIVELDDQLSEPQKIALLCILYLSVDK